MKKKGLIIKSKWLYVNKKNRQKIWINKYAWFHHTAVLKDKTLIPIDDCTFGLKNKSKKSDKGAIIEGIY